MHDQSSPTEHGAVSTRDSAEADYKPFGENPFERRGKIEGRVLHDCSSCRCREHEAVGKRGSKSKCAGIQSPPGDGIAGAAEFDAGTAAREIDGRHLVLLVCPPDRVHRTAETEI